MRVTEIHFNHGQNQTSPSIMLRDEILGSDIQSPEWHEGLWSKSVAYVTGHIAGPVTVKAKFAGGPASASVRIRVDAGAVLGDAECSTAVTFDVCGDSELTELSFERHTLTTPKVKKHEMLLRWQLRDGPNWREFQVTSHIVYTVFNRPSEPWGETILAPGSDSTQLPWTTALELACVWAEGATNQDAAARLITERLNGSPQFSYTTDEQFSASDESFKLSGLLKAIARNDPIKMNCIDCSNTVMALSNIIGGKLSTKRINSVFITRPVLPIGNIASTPDHWIQEDKLQRHQVAWIEDASVDGWVFDACYRLDLDTIDDDDTVHIEHLAIRMNYLAYRILLVGDKRGPATLELGLRRPRLI